MHNTLLLLSYSASIICCGRTDWDALGFMRRPTNPKRNLSGQIAAFRPTFASRTVSPDELSIVESKAACLRPDCVTVIAVMHAAVLNGHGSFARSPTSPSGSPSPPPKSL